MKLDKLLLFFSLLLITIVETHAQSSRFTTMIDSVNIFSSPRFSDVNNDGTKDIIIGAGIENMAVSNGMVAIDGKNGEIIWNTPSKTQIYTSALLQDINKDGIEDVFIGGRDASFFALDGKTGSVIWEFWPKSKGNAYEAGILNFYCTQFIDDQNKDGIKDLLVANGGDHQAAPSKKERPRAQLMVLCGKTGKVIANAKFPEERETYYAPHTYLNEKNESMIVFGSGGETIDGSLWEVPLKDLLKKDISKANLIVRDSVKGFILNSLVADLTGDEIQDIVNIRMNSTISAIEGKTHKTLWEINFSGYECYVTPSFGNFTGDSIPDVFTIISKGSFPNYSAFRLLVIDGKTGEIVFQEDSGFNQYSPGVAADINGDGLDEIIYVENKLLDPETFSIVNQIRVIDLKNDFKYYLGSVRNGMSMASTPSLVDLDGDGNHELIVAVSSVPSSSTPFSKVECIDINKALKSISWSGYLGEYENGLWKK